MNELELKLNTLQRELAIQAIQTNGEYWYLLAISAGIFLYLAVISELPILKITFILFCIVGLGFEYALFFYRDHLADYYEIATPRYHRYFIEVFTTLFLISFLIVFLLIQRSTVLLNTLVEKVLVRNNMERLTDTDIRTVDKVLPKRRKPYKPSRYFKKNYIFLGVNEFGKPSYIRQTIWQKSHVQISGTTGCGKGVFAAMLCVQALRNNETVVVFDPKSDEFLPHVLADECHRQGKTYIYVDLLGAVPQINLFRNKTREQIIELLAAGFNLSDTGAEADFYKLYDRKAAGIFAEFIAGQDKPLRECFVEFCTSHADLLKEAPKFAEAISEIAQLPILQAKESYWLKYLEQGSVIYIKGSMRNPKALKLQKMVLLSLMQQCESRDRLTAKSVLFLLDEFKYHISSESMQALGAIRDKKAHVMLAHQSIGDLRQSPVGLDPDSVISSVNENCSLKFVYKVHDPDTAEHFARMTGNIMIDRETRTFNRNAAFAEVTDASRTIRQDQRYFIDTNVFHSLPDRCGVFFGNGLAHMLFTSPIATTICEDNIQPTVFDEHENIAVNTVSNSSLTIAEELINVDS